MAGDDHKIVIKSGIDLAERPTNYNHTVCGNCLQSTASLNVPLGNSENMREAAVSIVSCKFCSDPIARNISARQHSCKIISSESPRQNSGPPSPSFSGATYEGTSPHAQTKSSTGSFSSHPSPTSVHSCPNRSDEDEGEDSTNNFLSHSNEYCQDYCDIDSSSISSRHDFHSFNAVRSSPSDNSFRMHITSSNRDVLTLHKEQHGPRSQNDGPSDESAAIFRRPEGEICDSKRFGDVGDLSKQPLDLENNSVIWFPPSPENKDDEVESNPFTYDDEDDNIEESGVFSGDSLPSVFSVREKSKMNKKEPLGAVVQGHFRALVSQLLQGEGLALQNDNGANDWLDIITTIAWQAANLLKPDTNRGGSMDPGEYVKVKRVASGCPSESSLVKGVVCTKNIKHKRMTSQYKNPRLLLLGGSLEYQRVPNQLASFNTLLQQENDFLRMIVSKIEARRPNVLLVEKSVSPYAQELLLAKEISLVINVKRSLFERIARCTGALVTPSVDNITTTQLGNCELFRLERISEEHEPDKQFNKKPSKTLMFFEGCPRRLGCTVLLRGSCREELKRVKHVVQYAVFAAYHLSLETSFLADEGARLPKMMVKPLMAIPERVDAGSSISFVPNCVVSTSIVENYKFNSVAEADLNSGIRFQESTFGPLNLDDNASSSFVECTLQIDPRRPADQWQIQQDETSGLNVDSTDGNEASGESYSATESHQSILVVFSSRCVLNGNVCERSRLLRIRFYGSFDKPLGRYLQDDLFSQASYCRSCKEPVDAHVICYTHQQGNLTINVKRLPSVKLPGQREGKIWMWHRCLRCSQIDGVPPATRRVVMSDAAWGLSFGKFLELSFSNHATANRVASCGHSLQRDCLRFYGFGHMVAFFRYSPINIVSVRLPPAVLEFDSPAKQDWIRKEAAEISNKTEALYAEISSILFSLELRSLCLEHEFTDTIELHNHIMELKELLTKERNDYDNLLQPNSNNPSLPGQVAIDILQLNHLRHALLIASHVWDRRLYLLESLVEKDSICETPQDAAPWIGQDWKDDAAQKDGSAQLGQEDDLHEFPNLHECPFESEPPKLKGLDTSSFVPAETEEDYTSFSYGLKGDGEMQTAGEIIKTSLERAPSAASILSDQIDSAWTGTEHILGKSHLHHVLPADGPEVALFRQRSRIDSPPFRKLKSPARVQSFDSALKFHESRKILPPSSLHLSTLRSFHASGDFRNMLKGPVSVVHRTYSQMSPNEAQKLNLVVNSLPSFISYASLLPDGARLMVPQNGPNDIVIVIYDDEPASIISYALSSKEYERWVADKANGHEGSQSAPNVLKESSFTSSFSPWQSFGSVDFDYMQYGSYRSEDVSSSMSSLFGDPKSSHLCISFEDGSSPHAGGRVKFSVTCYFAKEFDGLRKKCCPSHLDFIRSLSRCRRWNAQGGKSNVYFAKSFDERFIIKQVTKTELDSFEEFAPEYFKYLTDSLSSGSPTCLAKILGVYQVAIRHLNGGKETKMDLMVMENLFFNRSISRVYDLKGSARSRYVSASSGSRKVLLDMNLVETLRTKPIFLGSKAKRILERAVWNDTSFLASVDVMDYSLLVGVDEEREELVLGIIDFMRQYTWDKHLETWVKASGILGGPRNASPTVISPKQYKKRFRKAMATYFLTVPDQWSS